MSRRPPRSDPDGRGIGVAEARGHIALIDALRRAADEDGWFAPHGRTLRLRIGGAAGTVASADPDD
jgi:hypothetical protein